MGACQSEEAHLAERALKLSRNNIWVKRLEALQDIDFTTCICVNYLEFYNSTRLGHLWYDGKLVKATNIQRVNEAHEYDANSATFKVLMEDGCLATDAIFNISVPDDRMEMADKIRSELERANYRKEVEANYKKELESKPWDERPVIGDALESALIKFIQPIVDIKKTRGTFPVVKCADSSEAKIPFNTTQKFNLSICKYPQEDSYCTIVVKGYANKILAMCNSLLLNGKAETLDAEWKRKLDETVANLQGRGEEVFAFARKHLPAKKYPENYQYNILDYYQDPSQASYLLTEYTLSGLFTTKKIQSDNIKDLISKCIAAGIKVVLFGHEYPLHASATAYDLGIFDASVKVTSQTKLDSTETSEAMVISNDALKTESFPKWILASRLVFAGLKDDDDIKELVSQLRKQGQIVTLIGSNNIPAIKEANVAVANGITSNQSAKDSSHFILLKATALVELLKEILKTKIKRNIQSEKEKNRV